MSNDEKRPFDGLVILDLCSRIAGPYATKLFVDAGATVLKIEPREGDALRPWTASFQNLTKGESGPLFQYLNAGKQSIVLDPQDARDRARIAGLAERADLVFEDWGPNEMERRGLDPAGWLEENPRLSIIRLSPWGQQGPWADQPANAFTLEAATGSTDYRGLPDRFPVGTGGRTGDWLTGAFAGLSGLAAWRTAQQTLEGQIVDVSAFESMIQGFTIFGDLSGQFIEGPLGRSIEIPSIEPTQDGHIGFCTITGQQWKDFCSMIGRQDIGDNERYMDARNRMEDRDFVQGAIHDALREKTTAEWIELADLLRIPATPIGHGESLPEIDHMQEREVFLRAPGGFLQPRTPWRLESCEPMPLRPAPELDAHRREILTRLEEAPPTPEGDIGPGDLPFSGLRVVDLTAFWAGPYATSILSDLGADVIKVESIQRPDGMRFATSVRNDILWEWSQVFHGVNPGKRDVTLRLDSEEGLSLVQHLIAEADVVIENFSARVMPAFGLDEAKIKSLNPRAIFVRMPAFGLDGPWKDRAGFAMTVEQVSGLAWVTGYEDLPLVVRGLCDPLGSVHTVFALGLALEERERTGIGQVVEVALVEPALAIAAEQVLESSAFGTLLGRDGNRMPHAAPQGIFSTREPEERIAVSVTTEEEWRGLCRALGTEAWRSEERLSSHRGRYEAHDELVAHISAWARTQSREACLETLHAAGVPASAVVNAHALHPNPQLQARRFFQTMRHPVTGETRYPSFPAIFSAFERELHRTPPPTLGQHNREILQGELGLSAKEFDALVEAKIVGTRPGFM